MEEKNRSAEKQKAASAVEEEKESQQDLDLLLCDEDEPKRKKKKGDKSSDYSHTKVKSSNFLTNISYRQLNKNDHSNVSFVLDYISFIMQNLNLFSLERKFNSQTDQHYVNILWEKCLSKRLYRIVCREENFMILNQWNVTNQKATKIVEENVQKMKKTVALHEYFREYQLIYQYVYSLLFPKYVALNKNQGVQNRF